MTPIRTYGDFESALLLAAFCIAERQQDDFVPMKKILETYKLDGPPHWLDRSYDGNIQSGYFNSNQDAGPAITKDVRISPAGARRAEGMLRTFGEPPLGRSIYLEEDVSAVRTSESANVRSLAESAPASDRIVPLDHNQPEYGEIAAGLADIFEQVRQDNEVGETPEHRDRIMRALQAAQGLWAAMELRVVQLKVGVILAVDDAVNALTKLGRTIVKEGLVNLIIGYAKNKLGIDI